MYANVSRTPVERFLVRNRNFYRNCGIIVREVYQQIHTFKYYFTTAEIVRSTTNYSSSIYSTIACPLPEPTLSEWSSSETILPFEPSVVRIRYAFVAYGTAPRVVTISLAIFSPIQRKENFYILQFILLKLLYGGMLSI